MYVPVRDLKFGSCQSVRPLARVVSQFVTKIQFDMKTLIDEEVGFRAQVLFQIYHS